MFSAYGTTAALLLLGGQWSTMTVAAHGDLRVLLNVYAGLYVLSGVVSVRLLTETPSMLDRHVETPEARLG